MSPRIPLLVALLSLAGSASAMANTSDLSITNSGSPDPVAAGQYVSYTLSVTNNGPDPASGVTVTMPLPPRTMYIPGDSQCAQSGSNVVCNLPDLPNGGNATAEIVLRLTDFGQHVPIHDTATVSSSSSDPTSSNDSATFLTHVFNNSHDHHITVSKAEQFIDFNPGETKTATIACPNASDIMLDGSLRVDNVDQDTGTLRSVVVSEQRAVGNGYEFTATNEATGRAQGHLFGTCISKTTQGGGAPSHTHDVTTEPDQTVTVNAPTAGHYNVKVPCNTPNFVVAAAPGFIFGGGAVGELTYSVAGYDNAGKPAWDFGFDVTTPGTITASIKCLDRYVTTVQGHTHELWLSHIDKTFVVQPNAPAADVYNLDCSDEAKGIVAGYDLPFGVHMVGHEPQPKRRSFHLLNDTNAPLTVHLYLLCVGDRTGTDPPPPAAPRAISSTAHVSGSSVGVGVTCPTGGCSGTITLTSKSRTVGTTLFRTNQRGVNSVKIAVAKRYRGAVKSGKLKTVTAVVRNLDGKVVKKVKIRLKH